MHQDAQSKIVYGCITHVPLWVQYPDFVTPIHLGKTQGAGKLNLRDWAPDWEPYHPIIGGTAGAFALKNYILRKYPKAEKVGICQFRKFVTREKISNRGAASYRVMKMVDKDKLPVGFLREKMEPSGEAFLVSPPRRFGGLTGSSGLLRQYHKSHLVQDFLHFTGEAIELGILERDEVQDFFEEKIFIPGGIELGVYDADFWLKTISSIEQVLLACIKRQYPMRAGYQARALSFCAERLGSYLLLKHFRALESNRHWLERLIKPRNSDWKRKFVGHLNLIVDTGQSDYVAGT